MYPTFRPIPPTKLSQHARVRMQQRSIPHFIIELLIDYAHPVPAGDGCTSHAFTAETWAEAKQALGPQARNLDRYRNAYAIVSDDGCVVTAARAH